MGIGRAAEQLNERLGTREGEKDIYKISNLRKRQRQDLGTEREKWMLDLLKAIGEEEEMPRDCEESLMVYIYKQKGDVMECGNYRGIKLTEHGLKVLERIMVERLREIVKIGKQQYGFMRGRGTVDAVFIVRQLQEKRLEGNKELY
ncbi:uncharacterized protein [Macrobrachium rosenbergii]|uniref:uncharacterized protein n=1 Tax=Macrobrachium rosenbergii TaxID=79674 RepID=UPI0034D62673